VSSSEALVRVTLISWKTSYRRRRFSSLEDYLFVAESTSTYLLGNALALLDPASREAEIESFVKDLRRVITTAEEKFRQGDKLN